MSTERASANVVRGIHHSGISVGDLDVALAFWESFLGTRARFRGRLDRPYLAASVGIRIDVQNTAIRLMLNFVLTLLGGAIDMFINRVLLGLDLHWNWLNMLFMAIGNSLMALIIFPLLDRFQSRD